MINMKMTAEEAKEEIQPTTADAPEYPYGLTISLDEDAMAKLGITALPKVGTRMELRALVTVCGTSQYDTQGGEPESNLSLQITDMELAPAATPVDATKLYSSSNMNA